MALPALIKFGFGLRQARFCAIMKREGILWFGKLFGKKC